MTRSQLPQSLLPAFKIAPPGDVNLYTISESELETLERGTPESPLLAFGTALLGGGVSFGIALATANQPSVRLLVFLWVATLLGFIIGSLLIVLWRIRRGASVSVAQRIRARGIPVVEAQLASEGVIGSSQESSQ